MKKPLILLSSSTVKSNGLLNVTGDTEILYSDLASSGFILKNRGFPVILPSLENMKSKDLSFYIRKCDGLFLTGADTNVDPELYDGSKISLGRTDKIRDLIDIELIKLAVKKEIPILGICKGMQIINVALGGDLCQEVGPIHKVEGRRTKHTHSAQLVGKSILKNLVKDSEMKLNGGHEQAIKKLSKHLKPTAVASDGVIEAFEGKGKSFILGIQSHVELRTFDKLGDMLFKKFITVCKSV